VEKGREARERRSHCVLFRTEFEENRKNKELKGKGKKEEIEARGYVQEYSEGSVGFCATSKGSEKEGGKTHDFCEQPSRGKEIENHFFVGNFVLRKNIPPLSHSVCHCLLCLFWVFTLLFVSVCSHLSLALTLSFN